MPKLCMIDGAFNLLTVAFQSGRVALEGGFVTLAPYANLSKFQSGITRVLKKG